MLVRIPGADRVIWQAVTVSVAAHVSLVCALGSGLMPSGSVQGVGLRSVHLAARLVSSVPATPVDTSGTAPQEILSRRVASGSSVRKTEATAAVSLAAAAEVTPPAEAPASAGRAGGSVETDQYADYIPAQDLDIIPQPVTEPDSQQLNGMALPELEVGVNLYVDATGQVRQVVVDVPDAQQAAAQPLRSMFENTLFVPGRKNGKAVASILAIRIGIQDLGPIRHLAGNP